MQNQRAKQRLVEYLKSDKKPHLLSEISKKLNILPHAVFKFSQEDEHIVRFIEHKATYYQYIPSEQDETPTSSVVVEDSAEEQ